MNKKESMYVYMYVCMYVFMNVCTSNFLKSCCYQHNLTAKKNI